MTLRLGPRPKPPLEKQVQRAVAELFRTVGFKVRSTSQYRAAGIAIGIPDLMCYHRTLPLFAWFETKVPRPQGYDPFDRTTWTPRSLEPAQLIFRDDALRCGQRHYWGCLPQAEAALIDMGLATQRDGQFILQQRRDT